MTVGRPFHVKQLNKRNIILIQVKVEIIIVKLIINFEKWRAYGTLQATPINIPTFLPKINT